MADKKIPDKYIGWPAGSRDLISVMRWLGDETVGNHGHDFIEVAFIAQGSCMHTYNGATIRLIPGDILVISPHEEHSYQIDSKTAIYNCLFYPKALGEDWERLKEMKSIYDFLIVEPFYRCEAGRQEILHLDPTEAAYMESLLNKMLEEQKNRYQGFELVQKSNLVILLCLLGRVWESRFKEPDTVYGGKRDMLAEAIRFIEKNAGEEMTIDSLASMAYLSPGYFRKIFKEVTGLTPIEYINNIRISRACKLLAGGNVTISRTAEIVGINDLNYFSRLFKSLVGCSPSEFKRKSV